MVSGLSGTSSRPTHFFRDFARLTREIALLRDKHSASPKMAPDEAAAAADAQQSADADASDQDLISRLEGRNRDVVAHEAAHMAAGGAYIKGGASYTYQIGPDGKPYAIGGEVSIDMSPVPGNPRATIAKMMAIRAAASSPADPSGQDMSVAAAASQIEAQAVAQLDQEAIANSATVVRMAASPYTKFSAKAGAVVNAFA